MKHLLKRGEISSLIPETGGGLSGEVYLIKYNNQKYIVRKCSSYKIAKRYEMLSKKLEKYKILPKFLGRYGKNVFYEYIEGRDLKKEEPKKIFEQIGKITAHIDKLNIKGRYNKFKKQLNELTSGKYKKNKKVDLKRYRERLDKRRVKAVITLKEKEEVLEIYNYLKKRNKVRVIFDINDISPNNFRINNGKVYYVDIEGIKPRIRGLGIAKCFLRWAQDESQQKEFIKGYKTISKDWFFKEEYADLCYLHLIIQSLNYKAQIGRNYKKDLKRLKNLIKKYSTLNTL